MIGLALFVVFLIYLILVSALNSHVEVMVRLHPFDSEHNLPLYYLIFLFGLLGVGVTLLISVLDRALLKSKYKKLQKEHEQVAAEVRDLRQIATMERDAE